MPPVRFFRPDHVFDYVPKFLDNRHQLPEEQVVIGLKVIPSPEQDAFAAQKSANIRGALSPDRALEENTRLAKATLKSKISYFRGPAFLDIGMTCQPEHFDADFEKFYTEAPPEIREEVAQAIWSTQYLTLGDQQNFLPPAASPSGSE